MESIPSWTFGKRQWKWTLEVTAPWKIKDMEIMERNAVADVQSRCMEQVARASFMVGQPNREVHWTISVWDMDKGAWQEICNGKSRVKNGPKGTAPKLLH